jgi:diguanylate cyclase (GGDEF)-like protein
MRKTSIRRRLMTSTLLGCLVPFVIGFFVIREQTETWLHDASINHTRSMLMQAARHVDQSIIDNMKRLTELIALDQRLREGASALTDYTEYSPDLLTQARSAEEQAISSYFRSIVETHPVVTFVSFGSEAGGYVEYPPFEPTKSYDPRVRDWYRNSLIYGGVRVSEPYETSVTKDLVISIDRPVTSQDRVLGVVSLTIGLNDMMRHISEIDVTEGGYIYIFSPSGKVLLAPDHPEWLMRNASDLDTEAFSQLGSRRDTSYESVLDGVEKIITIHTSPASGWKYASMNNRSDILAQSRALSGVLLAVFLSLSFVVCLILLWISGRIARPILGLSHIIKRLARFDFSEADRTELKGFQRDRDEIADMARALSAMEKSYLELKNSLDVMDEQIQDIQVEERALLPIELSGSNPLNGVARSVNKLLDKVSDSLTRIDYLAEHDPLTNLPNRRSFHKRLSRSLSDKRSGVVIMLDMDNFKSINDTLGHVFGDSLLQCIAERLSGLASQQAFVSRFGGDEFLLLLDEPGQNAIEAFVQRVRLLFEEPIHLGDMPIRVEFSMGVARFPEDSHQYEQIIMFADMAMYEVKKTGKNRHAYFTSGMAAHVRFRMEMKGILEDALFHDGFCLVYQPQIRLSDGAVIGYEALLRLRNRSVSPAVFIPIAEEDGLIVPIGRAVVRMAVEQLARWRDDGLAQVPVSINFSALQTEDEGFPDYVCELLASYQLTPDALTIEITEHIFLGNREAAVTFLNRLRQSGFRIAVDDFGSEYSSLNYLSTLPLDTLKFDRELNLRLLNLYGPEAMGNLIAFVHSLHLFIVAEGVEEEEHVRLLKSCGCDAIQGYWFSPPLEPADISDQARTAYPLPQGAGNH